VANTRLYLVDDRSRPVAIGVPGEIVIVGEGVSQGYVNQPELTSRRFLEGFPGEPEGTRAYRTGDLARFRRDGNLEFLGRRDGQVKVRGYRVELKEIEEVMKGHGAVLDVAVTTEARAPEPREAVNADGLALRLERLDPAEAGSLLDRVEALSETEVVEALAGGSRG